MNPEMFCKNTSGVERRSHSSTKWAPLSADSANRMPLLAMIPTGWPVMWANPVTRVVPYSVLNSGNSLPSTMSSADLAGRVVTADHEPGDVLQEHQRGGTAVAQFDEVGTFECGLGEQDAVVGDDPHRVAGDVGEPGDKGGAVLGLELGELAAVDD